MSPLVTVGGNMDRSLGARRWCRDVFTCCGCCRILEPRSCCHTAFSANLKACEQEAAQSVVQEHLACVCACVPCEREQQTNTSCSWLMIDSRVSDSSCSLTPTSHSFAIFHPADQSLRTNFRILVTDTEPGSSVESWN